MALARCQNEVLNSATTCDDLDDDLEQACAFETGRVLGCYGFGFGF